MDKSNPFNFYPLFFSFLNWGCSLKGFTIPVGNPQICQGKSGFVRALTTSCYCLVKPKLSSKFINKICSFLQHLIGCWLKERREWDTMNMLKNIFLPCSHIFSSMTCRKKKISQLNGISGMHLVIFYIICSLIYDAEFIITHTFYGRQHIKIDKKFKVSISWNLYIKLNKFHRLKKCFT